jgi:16S rRNA (guanine966-N2)-methyltransferase
VPVAEGLRPTPDRVRETLFNWLAPELPGARCLDLFAGTGALCLEALSRGAGEAVMVEKAPAVAAALRANLVRLGARAAEVVNADALDYLAGPVAPFDIVFLDPPFRSDLIGRCAQLLAARGWVRPGGLVYVEAPARLDPLPLPAAWELVRSKRTGEVGYHLVRVPAAAAPGA